MVVTLKPLAAHAHRQGKSLIFAAEESYIITHSLLWLNAGQNEGRPVAARRGSATRIVSGSRHVGDSMHVRIVLQAFVRANLRLGLDSRNGTLQGMGSRQDLDI